MVSYLYLKVGNLRILIIIVNRGQATESLDHVQLAAPPHSPSLSFSWLWLSSTLAATSVLTLECGLNIR